MHQGISQHSVINATLTPLRRHSSRMARWDNSRARTLLLDFGSLVSTSSGRGGGGGGRGRGGRHGQGRHNQQQQQQQQQQSAVDGGGGWTVVDDDLAASIQANSSSRGNHRQGHGARAGPAGDPTPAEALGRLGARSSSFPSLGSASRTGSGGQRQQQAVEEFPSLQAAVASSTNASGATAAGPGSVRTTTALAAAPLVKVTVRCPCGRRSSSLAVREGEAASPLACDKECDKAAYKTKLADAFGVDDPDVHVAYFDRHRTPNYSLALLQVGRGRAVEQRMCGSCSAVPQHACCPAALHVLLPPPDCPPTCHLPPMRCQLPCPRFTCAQAPTMLHAITTPAALPTPVPP